jgi:two-component system, NtrC family, sensor kinase
MLHRHLVRQLDKLRLELDRAPSREDWQRFVEKMSRSFEDADRERYLLERSIELSSREMHELNARLATERDQFAQMFSHAPVGMARIELDGKISAVNPAFAEILGHLPEALERRMIHDLIRTKSADDIEFLMAILRGDRRSGTGETLFEHANGTQILACLGATAVLDERWVPQHVLVVLEDISERKRLEIELRHAQKLESVGRLAAGIAHEINTPIQFVGNNMAFLMTAFEDLLQLCESYRGMCEKAQAGPLGPDDIAVLRNAEETADLEYAREHVPRSLASSQDGIDRVAKIVQSMKSFAYPDRGEMTTADLNAALMSTLTVASNELKYVANVETDLQPMPSVRCYLSDLNQVFLNLLVNAAHAIGDVMAHTGEKGRIQVQSRVEGSHVVIAIGDTGTGIPEQNRDRIFDPFFTTKDVGKGTGQGLALARTIVVEKHGGTLTFDTEIGRGTTFYVRLPLLSESLSSAASDAAQA